LKERDRVTQLSLAAAFLILFLPLLWPLLTWRVFTLGDLLQFHLPLRFIYQDALRHGQSFLWSSALGSGIYLHAEGQSGMAHPFHLLIYRVLPLTAAFNLETLVNYPVLMTGTWVLLRRFRFTTEAALTGALMFAFSGFNLMHLVHVNMIAVVAHVPWLLWSADLLLTERTQRMIAAGFALSALNLASQILLGFPQGVWFSSVILAAFIVYRTWAGTRWTRVLLLGAALLSGIMAGGIQLLPTLDLARSSVRAATTSDFRLSLSMHPLNLVQLVSPYLLDRRVYALPGERYMHEFCIYGGAISSMSACWVALRWRELERQRQAAALLGLAAFGVVLALGRYGGVYPLLAHLPGLSSFRASTRHIVIVHIACAGLVALVVEDLLALKGRIPWRRLSWLMVPAALSVLIAVAVPFARRSAWLSMRGVAFDSTGPILVGTMFVVATAGLFALAGRGYRSAVPILIVLAALDLAWWGDRYEYSMEPARVSELRPFRGLPPGAQAEDLVRPTAVRNDMNLYAMWRLRSSTVYLGLIPATVLNPYLPIAKRVAGVKWDWTEFGWQAVNDTMPRARLMSEWQVSHDIASDAERVDISHVALVSLPPGALSGQPGTARMAADRPGVLVVDTDAPAAQLLVLTERFHAGWRADVDGTASTQLVSVFGDYMGCVVPAGRHRITLRFAPASARYGLWMTLIGLAAVAGGSVAISRGVRLH
jgi:hypothetical protein